MKIAVVGTGYVGLVAGVCFSDAGHSTTCVDNDEKKISALLKGRIPIFEPGLEDILDQSLKRKLIQFTTDLPQAIKDNSVIFVAVGTPEGPDGNPDMRALMSVVSSVAQNATEKKFLVLKSTVPVGTAQKVKAFVKENCPHPIEIINNPEFLKEGAAVEDFLRPDRVVIGCSSEEARKTMDELYEPFVKNGNPIIFMDNTSAEMTKYAANAFLSVKISFINELARLADAVGADINDVRKGFTSDRRINPAFFYPGVGFGGSCFPKDVTALIHMGKAFDMDMKLVRAAYDVNNSQRQFFIQKIKSRFPDLKGRTFAVWGLSFKPRTDDVREAPALTIIEALVKEGAKVRAYDPIAMENALAHCAVQFEVGSDPISITKGADALLLITEWNEFRNPSLEDLKKNLKKPVIFDGRNVLDPVKVKKLGFEYFCFGRESVGSKELDQ